MSYLDIKLEPILDSIEYIEMDDATYFSKEYSDYISNSKLALINPEQGGSPEKYLEGLSGAYSDSLTLGSAVHELILQKDLFEVAEGVERPTSKLGAMADELYKVYKKNNGEVTSEDIIKASDKISYYKGKMTEDRINKVLSSCTTYWADRDLWESTKKEKEPIYLDLKSREKLAGCISSVERNKDIQDLLNPEGILSEPISKNEAALFFNIKAIYNDKEVILKLKSKLDNFTIDLESESVALNDLKTTGHFVTEFNESFKKYHYNRQMAFYLYLLKIYVEKEYNIKSFSELKANMLVVSTIPDFKSIVYKVSKREIEAGFAEFIDLLKRVAYLEINGNI
jgi:hypothetical protein